MILRAMFLATSSLFTLCALGQTFLTQVNVNAAGQNIPGDAANEPSIAVSATNPNIITIGWRQFSSVTSNFRQAGYAYSADAGRHWQFPGVIQPGVFRSDPVLDADPFGGILYLSLDANTFACGLFHSTDGGATWGPAVAAAGGDKPWMTCDRTMGIGRGNVYATWSQNGCCDFIRSTNAGASFGAGQALPNLPYWGSMAVGPSGEVYVLGLSGNGAVILRSDNAQNPQQTAQFSLVGTLPTSQWGQVVAFNSSGPNPDGILGQGWIAVDSSNGPTRGFVYVVWSVQPPSPASQQTVVRFARSTDGGHTWSPPININTDPPTNNAYHWFATMSVAPSGRIDVVWNDTRDSSSPHVSRLYYSNSTDGGLTWSTNTPLSSSWDSYIGWPQQNKIGDYYHMLSDNDGANLAWAATFNGEQDVYFMRIGPFPCWGDLTGDRRVDLADLGLLLANFGATVQQNTNGDLNNDGLVNLSDLAAVLSVYGAVCD